MRYQFFLLNAAVAALLAVAPQAIGSSPERVGQFDFSYLTNGASRATPVQVFDDGKTTYFQFRAGEAIPAIFQNKDGQIGLLVPTQEGPYIRVAEIGGRFTLQLGRAQATVVYGGAGRADVPQISAVAPNGMKAEYSGGGYPKDRSVQLVASLGKAQAFLGSNALEANSYATPLKGDSVTWKGGESQVSEHQLWFPVGSPKVGPAALREINNLAKSLKQATRITIVGRDDESYKEGLDMARAQALRNAMLKAGIAADRIVVKTGVQGEAKNRLWPSDVRIETMRPTLIAKPTPKAEAAADNKHAYVKANVDELVRSGAISRDQALAILQRSSQQAPAQAAAAPQAPLVSVQVDVPADGFNFKASDLTVAGTIRRWAASTNYQVVWDAPAHSDAPINGDAVMQSASMKEALEKVVSGLQGKGYDIQATVYSNRVIRFTGVSK